MSEAYCRRTTCKKMGFSQRSSCRPYKNCFRKSQSRESQSRESAFFKGGLVRSNPELWERIKESVMQKEVMGTDAGEWSARKAQLAVKLYKEQGGKYKGHKSSSNSLVRWTRQDWRTRSGKPSHITGERYLPAKAIAHLSPQEYGATTRAKRETMKRGKQFSRQPLRIRRLTRKYRKLV
jgi:hypothetical protein